MHFKTQSNCLTSSKQLKDRASVDKTCCKSNSDAAKISQDEKQTKKKTNKNTFLGNLKHAANFDLFTNSI